MTTVQKNFARSVGEIKQFILILINRFSSAYYDPWKS